MSKFGVLLELACAFSLIRSSKRMPPFPYYHGMIHEGLKVLQDENDSVVVHVVLDYEVQAT